VMEIVNFEQVGSHNMDKKILMKRKKWIKNTGLQQESQIS
jgi:hypothetical protein